MVEVWFNRKINPWMSSMTSGCIPIQGAGVHVAECGDAPYLLDRSQQPREFGRACLGNDVRGTGSIY